MFLTHNNKTRECMGMDLFWDDMMLILMKSNYYLIATFMSLFSFFTLSPIHGVGISEIIGANKPFKSSRFLFSLSGM